MWHGFQGVDARDKRGHDELKTMTVGMSLATVANLATWMGEPRASLALDNHLEHMEGYARAPGHIHAHP